MKTSKTPLAVLFATVLLGSAAPGLAFTMIERNSSFDTQMTLSQIAFCDGAVKLMPGSYDVHFTSLGEGGVLATFLQGGARKGEAHGIIVVQRQTGVAAPEGKAHTFSSLGFNASSPRQFRQEGQKLTFVYGVPAGNQIQVGLSLRPVQVPAAHAGGDPH